MYTKVKTASEIANMRESGRMLASVLKVLEEKVSVGMSTKELAEIAKTELRALGGQPAFLGFEGFPDVLCVSINEQVVHGIPSYRQVIADGDIVSMDFGVTYRGMVTDSAISIVVGKSNKQKDDLVAATKQAMMAGIGVVQGGVKTGTIGAAVEAVLRRGGYGIVQDLVGHGVGHELHEDPNVPNTGKPNTGVPLLSGMTIAIEPMATLGKEKVYVGEDDWTIFTRDGSLAAHFEHTVLITDDGYEILTIL